MIYDFDELLSHAGHELECVYYGTKNQAINAAIECITCGAILIDLDPGDTLSKELAEDTTSSDGEEISIKWHIADVIERSRERGINLSGQQAKEILSNIKDKHDATIGVNWDVIDVCVDFYLDESSK